MKDKELPATFDAFLLFKKIDGQALAARLPDDYTRLAGEYLQCGYQSFDQRKKFLINDWRLAFPLPKAQ